MIAAIAKLDPVALKQAANACFSFAGALSLLLILGWCGHALLGGAGPYPQGGVWRRDSRGRAVCPLCAEVPDPEDTHPLLDAARAEGAALPCKGGEAEDQPEFPPELWAWLGERDLQPDIAHDGSVEWADVINALDDHEAALLAALPCKGGEAQ